MAKNAVRVGLDLEQSSIAAAQIKSSRTTQMLTAVAVRDIPEGLVFEGEVVDVDGLANELKSFWKEGRFAGRRVRLGVANQKIVVRTLEFPQIDEKELRSAVEFQAQEAIPIPVEEAILDYQVLSTVAGEGGVLRQKILLVAAQKDMIGQFMAVATKAGLTIEGIDLQAFALARALTRKGAFIDRGAPTDRAESTALVNIGTGVTNLVVSVDGLPQFTRVINLGCDALVQALVSNRGIKPAEAEVLRTTVGLSGEAPEGLIGDYYHTQEHDGQITKILIAGDGSMTRNIDEYLGQALHLPVEIGNPLVAIGENKSGLSPVELEAIAPRLAIAVGLALEDEE
jgi:type IV pilus assembly protein PilM